MATTGGNSGGRGSAAPAQVPAWAPLRVPVFRALWLAAFVSNVGTWMQGVGAAWLMTSLSSSPLLVSLVQAAATFPIFLAALPSGAIADVVDRRKLLIATQLWMLLAAALLGVLTYLGGATPFAILALTFALGLGSALNNPAWQAIQPELVGREEFPQAVALGAVGFNLARAVGPALGGLAVAAAGPGAVFLLNAASFVAVLAAVYRWRPAERESALPPEHLGAAVLGGLRYVGNAPALKAALVRAGVFVFFASALLGLLPVLARGQLGLGSGGYGLLLGAMGIGSVVGAAFLPRLRRALSPDAVVASATVLFAAAVAALVLARGTVGAVLAGSAMLAGGVGWIAVLAGLNTSVQTLSPAWVRARALSAYLLVFQGGSAAGSVFWGALAGRTGVPAALALSALGLVLGLATAFRWRLRTGEGLDLSPSAHWPEPTVELAPDPGAGPVLVTIEYRVALERAEDFDRAMRKLGGARRRGGAVRWEVFRDLADPGRYLEVYEVGSWAEHLRQHERVSVADGELEARVRSLHAGDGPPKVSHLVAGGPAGTVARTAGTADEGGKG